MFCLSGTMTPDKLRQKMDSAKKQNDPEALEKVIAECVSSGHTELIPDIQEARLNLQPVKESGRGLFGPLILISDSYIYFI